MEINWLLIIIVFLSTAIAEFFWTIYITKVGDGKKYQAGFANSVIVFIGAITYISYSEHWLYVIPATIGAFVGVVSFMNYNEYKEKRSKKT